MRFLLLALLSLVALSSCADNNPASTQEESPDWYQPAVFATWHWQLSGAVNTGYKVDMYDIDLFDSPVFLIQQLQSKNIKVICYFSAGSYEEWRSDAGEFNASDLGNNLDGLKWSSNFVQP